MNKSISLAAFAAGLAVIVWIGSGYIGGSPLALAMTVFIGVVYLTGGAELLRFQRATDALARALQAIPDKLPKLGDWLAQLPPSLQNPVRLRIEGERVGLPGPALTPYLVGLLVLLGMLGTFLGMVVTLQGAVLALESTSDLDTVRAALAAPVKGLGVAFGTSVAGVAGSAMLGLVSALCRRERWRASQRLDSRIATSLHDFSLTHQRQQAFGALQLQARALPEVVDKLQAMMAQMERHSRELNERLIGEQERFYGEARGSYSGLADSVGRALEKSLADSARLAGETIQPIVAETMSGIARETTALQQRVADTVDRQLDGIATRFEASAATVTDGWSAALARHEQTSEALGGELRESLQGFTETFALRSAALVDTLGEQAATRAQAEQEQLSRHLQAQQEHMDRSLQAQQDRLSQSLQQQQDQLRQSLQAHQEQLSLTLSEAGREIAASAQAQASGTIAEVARLMETAAEAPRAAAEVIGELRRELSGSMARDNELLSERSRIMDTLATLLSAIEHASGAQREAIDQLVASAGTLLERAAERFETGLDTETARLGEIAGQIGGGAVEVASVSEAFALAVRLFAESNDKMMTTLARIEAALEQSATRSDEQLAYTVAQAREIIDLSIMSQRRIMEELRQLSGEAAPLAGEA